MPLPKIKDASEITVGGVPAKKMVRVVKPYKDDRPGFIDEVPDLAKQAAEAASKGESS